ncbi:putative T7SS-secreted protein [Kitasatospora sp. NPDC050467]|uniref:putative T7SS-secreted protein n=1 Tax=Kitasatospora sp. NPDC050467 TaxID=3364053 RepID=UPI0037B370D1
MGLHFSITDLVDTTEAVIDSGVKAGGKAIQKGSHLVGGALDEVGLHGAAQQVNGWGDGVADGAGLKVGERGLDQTGDPKELVHGDAKRLNEVAGHLKKFHDAFEKTGTGLAKLDHEHWTGEAAEAFQKAFDPQPKQWLSAADACGKAAAALETFAHTVTWAQGEAAEAARLWKEAKKKSDAAMKSAIDDALTYDLRVKAYNSTPADQRPATPPAKPGEFKNPAEADFRHAEEKLDTARTQRDSAARTAADAIAALVASAPAMPSKMQILKAEVKDGLMAVPVAYEHFYGGLVKSGTDLIKLGRSVNPMDPYNLSHPAQYLDGLSTTTAGLIQAGDHPVDLLKGLVGSGWGNDPSEAGGRLTGNLLLGAGTGGGGTAATLAEREAAAVAENAAKKAAQEAAEKAAKEAAEKTAKQAADKASKEAAEKALQAAAEKAAATTKPVVPSPTNPAGLPEGWTIKSPAHETADAASGSPKSVPSQQVPHPAQPTPHPASGPHPEPTPASVEPNGAYPSAKPAEGPGTHHVGEDPAEPKPHGSEGNASGHGPEVQDHIPAEGVPGTSPGDGVQALSPDDFDELGVAQKTKTAESEISQGAKTFDSNAEASKFGADYWNDYAVNLPELQRKAVYDYTCEPIFTDGPTYRELNGYLRSGEGGTPEVLQHIAEIDKALAGHPIPETVVVTRGTDLYHIPMHPSAMVGKEFAESSFTSSSLGETAFADKQAVLHLKAPEGTPGLWVEKLSYYDKSERELLLARGLRWRADRVFRDESGQWQIYGEILP